jgi:hypothetical protein
MVWLSTGQQHGNVLAPRLRTFEIVLDLAVINANLPSQVSHDILQRCFSTTWWPWMTKTGQNTCKTPAIVVAILPAN